MVNAWIRQGVAAVAVVIAGPVLAGLAPPPGPATPVYALYDELEGDFAGLPNQAVDAGPLFGYSVAMHGDTLVVGAPRTRALVAGPDEGSAITVNLGAVFVFRLVAGEWQLHQRLMAAQSIVNSSAECGTAVAVSRFNLLVGCPHYVEPDSEQARGRVLVYERGTEAGDFSYVTTLDDTEQTNDAQCGYSVALLDGVDYGGLPLAAVGCPGRQVLIAGQLVSGGVDVHSWLFNWNHAGSINGGLGSNTRLGQAISLNTHAQSVQLAIGAPNVANGSGQVHIMTMGETATDWSVDQSYSGLSNSQFGHSVHLRGEWAVMGAPTRTVLVLDNGDFVNVPVGSYSIAARTCTFNPPPDPPTCTWAAATEFQGGAAFGPDPQNRLGHAVRIVATGAEARVVAGEPHYVTGSFSAAGRPGRVHHRLRIAGNWELNTEEPFFQVPGAWQWAESGTALASSGGWLAAGAPYAYTSKFGVDHGRVRVYAYNDQLFHDRFED